MGLYAAKGAVLVAARLGLGHAATRLLLHMALESWDDTDNPGNQPPRRYFASRESSAIALGYLAPDNGSESAYHSVKRAIAELVASGAIERVSSGHRGHNAEFNLLVDSRKLALPPLTGHLTRENVHMGNTRREFTPEYKDEAVKLV
ncbi:hypothetical protein E3O45_00795, partial [Cryobacterium sp. TMS1-20-1]|uniref:hypothetical protein n=1 Tax=Cryobacterium sp. TMS1-20-1 TaxID=1259223 RepID=UPI0010693881